MTTLDTHRKVSIVRNAKRTDWLERVVIMMLKGSPSCFLASCVAWTWVCRHAVMVTQQESVSVGL